MTNPAEWREPSGTITFKVYRVDAATGEKTPVRSVGFTPGVDPAPKPSGFNLPPCVCPRCSPAAAESRPAAAS